MGRAIRGQKHEVLFVSFGGEKEEGGDMKGMSSMDIVHDISICFTCFHESENFPHMSDFQ